MDDAAPAPEEEREPSRTAARTKRRVVAAVVGVVALGILVAWLGSVLKTTSTTKEQFAGVDHVDVEIESGDVSLVPATGDAVEVSRDVAYYFRSPKLSQGVDGSGLVIRQRCTGLTLGECSASYRVALPPQVIVHVLARHGSVVASGVRNDLDLASTTGKVTVKQAYGTLNLHTGNGAIAATDLQSLDVRAETDNGKATLRFDGTPVTISVTTVNGPIDVRVPKSGGSFRVDASSPEGKTAVDLRTDNSASRSITARSQSGAIDIIGD